MDNVRRPRLARKTVPPRVIGRYVMYDEIASGGMAAVHFGRFSSDAGFSRTVAIKYLHPTYARDAEFISMFLDEARLVSRIRHPNVASPLDVVVLAETEEIFLVMEYIHGETLAWLLDEAQRRDLAIPPNICSSIMSGALHGLHAAHEAVDEMGTPLKIVHRDISPQNIMVGADGVARVLDFGVAKAVSRSQSTRQGQVKGKVSYMAPEQLMNDPVDRRADLFAAGIVLWEALTRQRLFSADAPLSIIAKILHAQIPRPSSINGNVSQALDRILLKALNRTPAARFQTAREFAAAIEEEAFVASTRKVAEWVSVAAAESLAERAEEVWRVESSSVEVKSSQEAMMAAKMAAKSLRTTSQTVAILSAAELHAQPDPNAVTRTDLEAKQPGLKPETEKSQSPGGGDSPAPAELPETPAPIAEAQPETRPTPPPMPQAPPPTVTVAFADVTAMVRRRVNKKVMLASGMAAALLLFMGFTIAVRPRPPAIVESPNLAQERRPAIVTPLPTSAGSRGLGPVDTLARSPATPAAPVIPASRSAQPRHAFAKSAKPSKLGQKKDCVPPFSIDANGIRRIKPGCL